MMSIRSEAGKPRAIDSNVFADATDGIWLGGVGKLNYGVYVHVVGIDNDNFASIEIAIQNLGSGGRMLADLLGL